MNEMAEINKRFRMFVLLTLCVPALALAATPRASDEVVQMNVSFADLNLDNEQGIERLYRRIQSAAADACGTLTLREAGSVRRLRDSQNCYKELIDGAVIKVDNAALTKRHFG